MFQVEVWELLFYYKDQADVHREQLQQAGQIFKPLVIIGGEPIHEIVVNIFTEILFHGLALLLNQFGPLLF
jgi:hypothetical protein